MPEIILHVTKSELVRLNWVAAEVSLDSPHALIRAILERKITIRPPHTQYEPVKQAIDAPLGQEWPNDPNFWEGKE